MYLFIYIDIYTYIYIYRNSPPGSAEAFSLCEEAVGRGLPLSSKSGFRIHHHAPCFL